MRASRQSLCLPRQHRSTRGFTLVEILVTIAIMSLVVIAAIAFTIQALNIYYYDTGRILVNKDIRSFTQQISSDAQASNYFYIYPSFFTRWNTSGGTSADAAVSDGQSGDFLVLVFNSTAAGTGVTTITRLVGYYRNPANPDDPTSTGPVMRFDVSLNPAVNATSTTIASLLDTYVPTSTAGNNTTVVQLAQGLSNGTLFYDFYGRSVMIKGQIYESGNEFQQAVNTYNFTVSPRD